MAATVGTIDLGGLGLVSGEARKLDLEVGVEPLASAGQRYVPRGGIAAARVDVSHTTSGYAARLRFAVELEGPCMRCLEPSRTRVEVDAGEVHQPGAGDDELVSPYFDEESLDLVDWARDALALALPVKLVCREDCRGLCAVCGADLNDDPDHEHERAPDPRWAKLSELKLD